MTALLLLLLSIGGSGAALAQDTPVPTAQTEVTVQSRVDRSRITIGDPIRYTVEIAAPEGVKVTVPIYSDAIGEFQIIDLGDAPPRKEAGRVVISRWYSLTTFSTGEKKIPAPRVTYVLPGETQTREADGSETTITVDSLLAEQPGAADIRDIKPMRELPFDWQPVYLAAGALAVLFLLGGAVFYLLNRPKRAYVVPPTPPAEIALAALSRLRARRYLEEGRFDAFYIELSSIARRYLEDRFRLRAPEMTTEEFLVAAGRDPHLNTEQRRLLGEFLVQADLVKFARALPSLGDAETAYEAARRFVEETRPAASVTEAEAQHAAA